MGISYHIPSSVVFCSSFYKKKKGTCFPLLLETEKTETVSLSHPPNTECVGHQNTFRWGSATRTTGKIQFSKKYEKKKKNKFLGDRWGKMFYPLCIRFSLFFWRITALECWVDFCHTTRISLNYIYKLYTCSLLSLYYIFCIGITGFLLEYLQFPTHPQ